MDSVRELLAPRRVSCMFTDEHRANLSIAQKRSSKCQAARDKLHAMPQCRPGREFTAEHRARLSTAAKRREAHKRGRRTPGIERPSGG